MDITTPAQNPAIAPGGPSSAPIAPRPPARRRRVAPLVLAVGAGVAVIGGGYAAIGWKGKAAGHAGRPGATADLAMVSTGSFDITTTVSGDLQAKKQIEVRSELESESTIMEIVAEGTVAKKGDQLVVLNSDALKTKLLEEQSRVESARAELTAAESAVAIQKSENESKLNQAELKLTLARLALDQWEHGERVQKLKDIELALDKTDKDLKRLREKYEQSVKLNTEGFLSRDALQLDEIALRDAEAARAKALLDDENYSKYQEPMDRAKKASDVTEAKAERERTEQQNASTLATKEADLTNKKRQHQMRTDNVAKLEKQIAACTLTAPSDGLVVYASSTNGDFFIFNGAGPLQVGRRVQPNETLIVLPDTSEMLAQVRIPESLSSRVSKGVGASVKVDAAGGEVFGGTVDSVGVLAESSWRDPNRREYTVKILLKNERGVALKPSMRCEATIMLGHVDDSLTLPVQAVFTDELVKFVYVPRGGKYARVPIQIGQRSDTVAQVTVGLKDGERVLIREPSAAEVLAQPWDAEQLKLCNLKVNDEGKVVYINPPKGPGGMRMAGPGGGAPEGAVVVKTAGEGKPGAAPAKPEGKTDVAVAEKPAGGDAKHNPESGAKPEAGARPEAGAKPEVAAKTEEKPDGKAAEQEKPAKGDEPTATSSSAAPVGR
jgi:HlyD family secretion protein